MVIHSPKNFSVHRTDQPEQEGSVPPSVAAAGASAASAVPTAPTTTAVVHSPVRLDQDLLQDFASWDGDNQAASTNDTPAKEDINVNVHVNAGGATGGATLTGDRGRDDDKISVAGSVSGSAHHTPPNPFTPDWFAQIIGAAASAAATAAITASSSSTSSRPPPPDPSAPRRLNDRKVPDFWEDRPEFWFRIFDSHLSHFNPSEQRCFDALLPLLTPAARSVVHSVISSPSGSPYSKARDALLRHFGRTPRQKAREAREARSLGDRLPSEFLDHVIGLLPDFRTFYEIALLDALPPNARVAALQHTDVHAMARAADAVVLENRAAAESDRSLPAAVSSLSLLDGDLVGDTSVPLTPQTAPAPVVSAVSRGDPRPPYKRTDTLCAVHARWGKEAYKCLSRSCKMRSQIKKPPPSLPPASGNGGAGGR